MGILAKNTALGRLLAASATSLARAEHLDETVLTGAIDAGRMVLLANPAHKNVTPTLIGQPAMVKVNANIGTSVLINDVKMEMQKVRLAHKAGAHTVMDLSTAGDLHAIRKDIIAASDMPVGTVPLYGLAQKYVTRGQDPSDFSVEEFLEEIERQAEEGVDFMTLHCGVTARGAAMATGDRRVLGIVSRGGSILARWMKRRGAENPLLERFDDVLGICLKHNVTISLGDGLRPGAGADAGDAAQWEEVVTLGELTLRAWERGVQIMIEGPGHVPLHLVQSQIEGIKRLTHYAPLYVLGPLTTDCAPGYDHIAGAIGGAMAAYFGADFLCYLTPAEHLTLPGPEDVWAGVKASLVAAQSAETALGRSWAVARDLAISKARAALDWEAMAREAIDPQMLRKRRENHRDERECAMCGTFCAIRMVTGIDDAPVPRRGKKKG
ncbi:phosphomethylpyrimidine synthase ThiC [Desulfolutivibrio sulfoxidireducens]|uniref:phosphomethylpyrimidine synthase ThiC n=1 Tax=Desulfolutivibrio sulfoxidireducens TaxID=2773299 RepID=UPI00159E8F03|nr:phosphomethylpyrimidine synthase ThiC [Desulfolutivibrio sulfoxidireducens]QLA16125.1 phosphomethylpyrimidine synthase ThiC [Desulfolutivibrio sulfoxidireducens]